MPDHFENVSLNHYPLKKEKKKKKKKEKKEKEEKGIYMPPPRSP